MRATHAFPGTLPLRHRHAGSANKRTRRKRCRASQCVHDTPQECGFHCGYPIRLSKRSLDLRQKAQIKGATPPEHKHWHNTDTYANACGYRQGWETKLGETTRRHIGQTYPGDVSRARSTRRQDASLNPISWGGSIYPARRHNNHTPLNTICTLSRAKSGRPLSPCPPVPGFVSSSAARRLHF